MKGLSCMKCLISTRGNLSSEITSTVILALHQFLSKHIRQVTLHEDSDKPLLVTSFIIIIYLKRFPCIQIDYVESVLIHRYID